MVLPTTLLLFAVLLQSYCVVQAALPSVDPTSGITGQDFVYLERNTDADDNPISVPTPYAQLRCNITKTTGSIDETKNPPDCTNYGLWDECDDDETGTSQTSVTYFDSTTEFHINMMLIDPYTSPMQGSGLAASKYVCVDKAAPAQNAQTFCNDLSKPHKCLPGWEHVGKGFDLSKAGDADALRDPVYDLTFSDTKTEEVHGTTFYVPVEFQLDETVHSATSNSKQTKTSKSTMQSVTSTSKQYSVGGSVGVPGVASLTATAGYSSGTYQDRAEAFKSNMVVTTMEKSQISVTAELCQFCARCTTTDPTNPGTLGLQEKIQQLTENLPADPSSFTSVPNEYTDFINRHGTHLVYYAGLGVAVRAQKQFEYSQTTKTTETELATSFSRNVAGSGTAFGVQVTVTAGEREEKLKRERNEETYSRGDARVHMTKVGGNPATFTSLGFDKYAEEVYDSSSANNYPPAMIKMQLTPIWQIVAHEPTRTALYRAIALRTGRKLEIASRGGLMCNAVTGEAPESSGDVDPVTKAPVVGERTVPIPTPAPSAANRAACSDTLRWVLFAVLLAHSYA